MPKASQRYLNARKTSKITLGGKIQAFRIMPSQPEPVPFPPKSENHIKPLTTNQPTKPPAKCNIFWFRVYCLIDLAGGWPATRLFMLAAGKTSNTRELIESYRN